MLVVYEKVLTYLYEHFFLYRNDNCSFLLTDEELQKRKNEAIDLMKNDIDPYLWSDKNRVKREGGCYQVKRQIKS